MDVLLVGFIAGLVYGGLRTGLLRRLLGLAFMALAFVLGAYLREPIGGIVTSIFPNIPSDYAGLVGYTVAFPLILGAAHLIAHPFVKGKHLGSVSHRVDQVLGGIFGGVEAVLLISAVVVILDTYFGVNGTGGHTPGLTVFTQFRALFDGSTTVHLLRDSTVPLVETVLGPLLPRDISTLLPTGLPRGGFPRIPGIPGG